MSVGRAERLKAAKRGSWTGAYAKVALAAEKKERQRAARVLKSGARAAGVTGKATGNVIRSATAKMRAYKPLEGG